MSNAGISQKRKKKGRCERKKRAEQHQHALKAGKEGFVTVRGVVFHFRLGTVAGHGCWDIFEDMSVVRCKRTAKAVYYFRLVARIGIEK